MINIGVIGYGFRGKVLSDILLKLDPEVRISAVADTRWEALCRGWADPASAPRFYETAEELLDAEELDGVIVSTRCSSHARIAIQVLERRIPFIVEKPVATKLDDLLALKSAYERSGTEVAVPFALRLSPLGRAAKEIADSGKLGTIEHVQAINNVPYGSVYFQNWYRDEKEIGGLFLQKATHDFDLIQYILGQRPAEVSAMRSKQIFKGTKPSGLRCENCDEQDTCPESAVLHRKRGESVHGEWCCFAEDTGNEDSGSAIVRYESGMHASYSQNFFVRYRAGMRKFRFMGYKGTMEFDYFTKKIHVYMHHANRMETYDIPSGGDSHGGGDTAVCQSLLDTIKHGKPSQVSLAEAMTSALLCLKATKSAETRTFQEVNWQQ